MGGVEAEGGPRCSGRQAASGTRRRQAAAGPAAPTGFARTRQRQVSSPVRRHWIAACALLGPLLLWLLLLLGGSRDDEAATSLPHRHKWPALWARDRCFQQQRLAEARHWRQRGQAGGRLFMQAAASC